jgi:DNA-binding NarL/FixJ family response regulator
MTACCHCGRLDLDTMERVDQPHDPAAQCRLLVIGSRRLFCQGLEALFCPARDWHHVCAMVGAEQATRRAVEFQPDVVLIDLRLPDGGAFATARALRSQHPQARLLFLDESFHPGRVRAVLSLRGAGYFTQDDPFEALADGVRQVARGGRAFSPVAEPHLVRTGGRLRWKAPVGQPGLAQLTRRELEVLVLLAQGLSVKGCAEQLRIRPSTADNHKSRLMRKLGVHKVVDLVHLAIREGLLAEDENPDAGPWISGNLR